MRKKVINKAIEKKKRKERGKINKVGEKKKKQKLGGPWGFVFPHKEKGGIK